MSISRDKLHRLIFADYPYVVRPARAFRRLHASKKEKKICVLHFNIPKASVLTRMVIAVSRSVYTPALSARNPRSRAVHTHTASSRTTYARNCPLSFSLSAYLYTQLLSPLFTRAPTLQAKIETGPPRWQLIFAICPAETILHAERASARVMSAREESESERESKSGSARALVRTRCTYCCSVLRRALDAMSNGE